MVPNFDHESWTSKMTGANLSEKCLYHSALMPSLPRKLLFVWKFIDFMISSKDIWSHKG